MIVKRIAVTIVGFAIIFIGILLLVLPGPGIIVIAIGIAVLAIEYEWARKLFDKIRRKTKEESDLEK